MQPFYFTFSSYGPTPSRGLGVLFGRGRLLLTESPDNPSSAVESSPFTAAQAARRTLDRSPRGTSYYWDRRPDQTTVEPRSWTLAQGLIWRVPSGRADARLRAVKDVDSDLRSAREALASELDRWVREAFFGITELTPEAPMREGETGDPAIRALEATGWTALRTRGDHQQFRHPTQPRLVTVARRRGATLPPRTLGTVRDYANLEDFI